MSSTPRDAATQLRSTSVAVGARGDVVEHELVGALVAIARGELEDVADDSVIAEAHALDDLAVADVEAGDYAFGKNGASSFAVDAVLRAARVPLIAAATPVARARADRRRRARRPTPASAIVRIAAHALRRTAPGSAPTVRRRVRRRCRARVCRPCGTIALDGFPERRASILLPAMRRERAGTPLRIDAHVEGQDDRSRRRTLAASPATSVGLRRRQRCRPRRARRRARAVRRPLARRARRRRPGCSSPTLRREPHDHARGWLRGRRVRHRDRRRAASARPSARYASSTSADRRRRRFPHRSRPCSRRTQRPPRRSMAGIEQHRVQALRKLREHARARPRRALRVKLRAEEIASSRRRPRSGSP